MESIDIAAGLVKIDRVVAPQAAPAATYRALLPVFPALYDALMPTFTALRRLDPLLEPPRTR